MATCLAHVPWKFYLSRGFSSWGDRMWMFAVGLFMMELSPGSLKWTAIYGLCESLAVIFLAPLIGRWVDQAPRLQVAWLSLAIHNLATVACSVCVTLTFYFRSRLQVEEWGMAGACSLIAALGTISALAAVATSVAVDKDWVALMVKGDANFLARMNSTRRSIDLATNVLAPIVVGQIMYFISHTVAAMVIAGWNFVSFFFEFYLLRKIFEEYPDLASKSNSMDDNLLERSQGESKSKCCGLEALWSSWKIYLDYDVRNAGLALACLYMTVLGFDSITTSYAYSQGVSESILGLLGGLGALIGLIGSLAFPSLVRCVGLERTGLWGFGLEVTCLTMCVASVWSPGSPFDPQSLTTSVAHLSEGFILSNSSSNGTTGVPDVPEGPSSYTSVILLMTGIITARFGLWVADLSVNQVLQTVDDDVRGTINGVQSSMNMLCNTCKLLLVIALPRPATFGFLICASFSAICLGWVSYATYSLRKRGHLLPFHRICVSIPPDELHQVTRPKIKGADDADAEQVDDPEEPKNKIPPEAAN